MASIWRCPPERAARPAARLLGEVGEEIKHLVDATFEVVLADEGAHLQIFADAEGGEDVAGLGDVAKSCRDNSLRGHGGDVRAAEIDASVPDFDKSDDGLHQGGLAAAVGADYRHNSPSSTVRDTPWSISVWP